MAVSAARLREAAELMRAQHGPEHQRHVMWNAIATWLDHAAIRAESNIEHGGASRHVWSHQRDALAVADAYLADTT